MGHSATETTSARGQGNATPAQAPLSLKAKRFIGKQLDRADVLMAMMNADWRRGKKYREELAFWDTNIQLIHDWYEGRTDWWGVAPPKEADKIKAPQPPLANAILTLHKVCPIYPMRLKVPADCFKGQRILEVGSGPLVPIVQFTDCERHALDPLMDMYLEAGWPTFAFPATCIRSSAEEMPYPDGYFDAVMSVNALDHVDNFEQAASEIVRVTKPGGQVLLEMEYHEPRTCEPQHLTDERVLACFAGCQMTKVADQTKRDALKICGFREDILSTKDRMVVWHGVRDGGTLSR